MSSGGFAHQDWEPVVFRNKPKPTGSSATSKATAVAQAKRAGATVVIEKKFAAGENRSAHSAGGGNLRKIEDETEDFNVVRVDRSFSVALQQARTQKGMTQKDLATRICEKPSVIADYESGRAIPNPQIINKLDRALGTHLPRSQKKK